MFNKRIGLAITLFSMVALAACSTPAATGVSPVGATEPAGIVTTLPAAAFTEAPALAAISDPTATTAAPAASVDAPIAAVPAGLTPAEAAGLAWMREEEKLAHDVYLFLYTQWGANIFNNIAQSEQTHTDAVLALLNSYGLADPAAGKAAGEFTDPTLQALYNQLVAQGGQSLADALKVGAAIEEIDILDLQRQTALVAQADITLAYQNLEMGSRNHLRSFTKQLQNQAGETYQPQHLTAEAYQAILTSPMENNGQGGQGGNGQQP